jgi:cytidylate kinase
MDRLRTIAAMIQSGSHDELQNEGDGPRPFITIARQAGAGGHSLMERLLERLRDKDGRDPQWSGYDRELIDRVAEEHGIHQALVERLENEPRNWLDELFVGLSADALTYSELSLARKVAQTIRGLAERGRCIIVGRGGVFVTRGMPGGVHVYLVAPREDRIRRMKRQLGVTEHEAARHVDELDQNRQAFYERYFPLQPLRPETFTLTINTSLLDDDRIVDVVLRALPRPAAPRQTVQTRVTHV